MASVTMHDLAPAPAASRLRALDALRGFALLGITLVNILYWSGWVLMTPAQQVAHASADARRVQWFFDHLLLDGKFYTLFSLMFGVGCALQLRRLQAGGHDAVRVYRRRMAVLVGFGLVHTFLVWDGDILLLYALLGLLLPWFARLPERRLPVWAALLVFVVPLAGRALFDAAGWNPGGQVIEAAMEWFAAMGGDPAPEAGVRWLHDAGWREQLAWNSTGTLFSLGLRIESWRLSKVLGIMVLGLWLGRRIARGQLPGDTRLLRRTLFAGLLVGLPASLVYASLPDAGQSHWSSMVGTVPLALAYAAAFLLAWPKAQRVLGIFVAPGRMPLTNYLGQSVFNGLVFFGIGFGWIGQLPLPAIYGYALSLFALQAMLSHWWLARHPQGPAEALWRRLTYPRHAAT
ncbi:MAG: DUF418 domain-containing protein [Lysobacteraceae bacterium]|nr:MAG: DUF418 domain-containing protein [Xanthomonadaceae bacterium]